MPIAGNAKYANSTNRSVGNPRKHSAYRMESQRKALFADTWPSAITAAIEMLKAASTSAILNVAVKPPTKNCQISSERNGDHLAEANPPDFSNRYSAYAKIPA